MEIWKEITGFNNYAISTLGRVRRLTKGPRTRPGRILKPQRNSYSYPTVGLCGGGKQATRKVHQLVATAFLWPRPGLQVNHIDGDKTNNRLDNLELVTASKNAPPSVSVIPFTFSKTTQSGRHSLTILKNSSNSQLSLLLRVLVLWFEVENP